MRYMLPVAGLVNDTETRVRTEALEIVVLPSVAVSDCTSTVKLVAVVNWTQTSMVQVLLGKGLPSVSCKLPSAVAKPICW